jgi:hypothetical protein
MVLIFTRGWVDPRAMVQSEGNVSLKNPVTPPGINPRTVWLVAQCLNHYAIPGPHKYEVKGQFPPHQFTVLCSGAMGRYSIWVKQEQKNVCVCELVQQQSWCDLLSSYGGDSYAPLATGMLILRNHLDTASASLRNWCWVLNINMVYVHQYIVLLKECYKQNLDSFQILGKN